jgi:hypothetical protein
MRLIIKDGDLFAVDEADNFIGKIINEISGKCCDNPANDEPGVFAKVFGGYGYIYHQEDNPPNPFFIKSWSSVFENPDLLPSGTKNIFIDQQRNAEDDFFG